LVADFRQKYPLLVALGLTFGVIAGLLKLTDLLPGSLKVQGAVIVGIAAFGIVLIGVYLSERWSANRIAPTSLQARLETLAKNLADAGQAASAVEAEIRARQEAVQELGRLSDQYEALAKVNEKSAKAVESAVARIVNEGQRQAFWSSTLVGFALGVLTSLLGSAIWSAWMQH
jgi:ElaB/YqjD/DUF883 family membrane-anchored ribosome-binding protein